MIRKFLFNIVKYLYARKGQVVTVHSERVASLMQEAQPYIIELWQRKEKLRRAEEKLLMKESQEFLSNAIKFYRDHLEIENAKRYTIQ
ncbi:MAG: hypothetical protein JXR49_09480 [Acidobacteria bacterium]|nr:hypothetical protein [Acidobacteriota bacterium]